LFPTVSQNIVQTRFTITIKIHQNLILQSRYSDKTAKGVRKGGGVKKTLELDILQKFYYLRKGDKLFSHTFCLFVNLMQIPRNKFACKFQGTL